MRNLFSLILLCFFIVVPNYGSANEKRTFNSALANTEQATSYVCPMHSHIVRDHPGTCPICGMDLVARERKSASVHSVNVSGEMQQAMALTTETVKKSKLWRFISTYGSVQYDETGLSHIHPRASGWIEKLAVNSVGERVKQGQLLYQIYSPELLVAQEEFLSLLDAKRNDQELLERGRTRLRLLGFNNELIQQLEKSRKVFYRVPYYAAENGVVSLLDLREGMYVEPDIQIMTLANLSRVWVIANVFEHQINWVKEGQSLELDLPALDLNGLDGKVEFIYPTLDPVTRTLQVRLALQSPQQQLKPDMLAKVRIYAGAIEALNIPTNALIQTEKHNIVFVRTANDSFERRSVNTGLITNQRVEILSGLDIGEEVVTSGQFLLDAEASLSNVGSFSADSAQAQPIHQH